MPYRCRSPDSRFRQAPACLFRVGDDQAEDGDGGTGAADEGPVDRPPVRCSDRFAAPAVSAGLLLLQPSAKFL